MISRPHNSLRVATAILAAFVTLPLLAQTGSTTSPSNAQVQTGTSVNGSVPGASNGTETLYATGQPLDTKSHEGFWGHLNPFARKTWVRRQLNPVKDRLNELDELTAANSRDIKDVDSRAQAGIAKADSEAQLADQHATTAGNTANQAQQVANQASTQTTAIGNAVNNLDQYQTVTQVEIRFRSSYSPLGRNSKDALDQLVSQSQGQKGYLIEVQGYSPVRGQAGIADSHRMAEAVTRYLVTERQVPLYRIHEIGLGNAALENAQNSTPHRHRSIVEVTLMHNSLSTLSASNAGASTTGAAQSSTAQSSSNGTASQPSSDK